jgi:hypothetical protein
MWLRTYSLKEILTEVMTPIELEAHSIMTRIFFNLRKEGLKTRLKWADMYDVDIPDIPIRDEVVLTETIQSLRAHVNYIMPSVNRVATAYVQEIGLTKLNEYTSLF